MSLEMETNHQKEMSMYLNNYCDNTRISYDNDQEVQGVLMDDNRLKDCDFIHNNIHGGPDNNGNCPCCGRQSNNPNHYLPLNFECYDVEDHPDMCYECAILGSVCCIHHWAKKNNDLGEDELLV